MIEGNKMNRLERVTKPLMWFMALLFTALAAGCGGGGGGGGATILGSGGATIAPTVTAVAPLAGATGVPINLKKVTAAFSKAMDPATITTASFTLACGGTSVTGGAVTYLAAGNVATLTLPAANLPLSTVCTATITTGAKDTAGTALASNFVWTFTTGATADVTKPRVASTNPIDTASTAPTNTAITAVFAEDMDPTSILTASFTLTDAGGVAVPAAAIPVTYAVGSRTVTFHPAAVLVAGTTYTATIKGTGAAAVVDLFGNVLAGGLVGAPNPTVAADYVWHFTTATPAPASPVSVLSTNPVNASTVCANSSINATFSVPSGLRMDPATITSLTFTVLDTSTSTAVTAASVSLDGPTGLIATFVPLSSLIANHGYTVTIKGGSSGVKDLAVPANTMTADKVWSFTAGPNTVNCPAPVALNAAAPFGSLDGTSGATNTGINTVITGDMSSTATTTSSITGFHDSANDIYTETGGNIGLVTGKIYTCTNSTTGPTSGGVNAASCTIATSALAAAQTAYNTLAGLAPGLDPSGAGGELGGLTLTPGTYTTATSFKVGNGNLTLDAQGNANAVWVFQMGSTLTVGDTVTPRSILLINGAQAKNVFWQVGSSATINGIVGGGTIVGNIMAAVKVTFSTVGVAAVTTLNGRAVGLTAQTIINNTVINVPAP
jgi:hypothetical protein